MVWGTIMLGLIHIYCGEGKGKTTASVGLTVRAAGAGKKILFTQFFKNGISSEIKSLKKLEQVETNTCTTHYGFFKNMSAEDRERAQSDYTKLLEDTLNQAGHGVQLLVLDEVISACNSGMVQESRLIDFLQHKPTELEVVLTGRNPSGDLLEIADYITEMRKIKHPYDRGVKARKGVEF